MDLFDNDFGMQHYNINNNSGKFIIENLEIVLEQASLVLQNEEVAEALEKYEWCKYTKEKKKFPPI